MAETLIFRADATADIGIGHVMRCLALAQAWQERGGRAVFLSNAVASVEARLRQEGVDLKHLSAPTGSDADLDSTSSLAHDLSAQWAVVDGYAFDTGYRRGLSDSGLGVLWIDDLGHTEDFCADLVLNQNLHAVDSLYASRGVSTHLMLGPRFALLRREFRNASLHGRKFLPQATKLLLTVGGSDKTNVTQSILDGVAAMGDDSLEIRIVVGPANPHGATLEERARRCPGRVEILTADDEMPELMAWADVAISAAGSTSWELAYMGLPSLLVALAPNQAPVAESLSAMGATQYLDESIWSYPERLAEHIDNLMSSATLRSDMSRRACDLVDGEGAARVVMRLRGDRLRLRPARVEDREILWRWANDPEVRRQSFSPATIPWETHLEWFGDRFDRPDCLLLVALDSNDHSVGQVRFDLSQDEGAEISVSLDKNHRGCGHGTALIEIGVQHLFGSTSAKSVHAYVRPENRISLASFLKARFAEAGRETVRGVDALHLQRNAVLEASND